jgi:hypothetical protein
MHYAHGRYILSYSYQEQPDIYDNYYSDDSKQKPKGNVIVS